MIPCGPCVSNRKIEPGSVHDFLDLPGAKKKKWLHEGGYFRAEGVFRPSRDCMMSSTGKKFCPVCCEEMAKAIVATCGEKWDDAAFHKKHPLRHWK